MLYLYKSNSNSRSNSDSSANCRGNHRKTVFIRLFLGELFQLRSLENKLSYRKRFQGVFQHAPVKLRRVCAADIRTVAVKLVDLRAGVSGFAAYRKAIGVFSCSDLFVRITCRSPFSSVAEYAETVLRSELSLFTNVFPKPLPLPS